MNRAGKSTEADCADGQLHAYGTVASIIGKLVRLANRVDKLGDQVR